MKRKKNRGIAALLVLILALSLITPTFAAEPVGEPAAAEPALKVVTVKDGAIQIHQNYMLYVVPQGTDSSKILANLLFVTTAYTTKAGEVTFPAVRPRSAAPVDAYLAGTGFLVPYKLPGYTTLLGSGALKGDVKSGVIPEATKLTGTVTLVDGETGYRYIEQTVNIEAGEFSFPSVAPGNYQVEVRSPGYVPVRPDFVAPISSGTTETILASIAMDTAIGDVNGDSIRNAADVEFVVKNMVKTADWGEGYPDLNASGTVDTADLQLAMQYITPHKGTANPTISIVGSSTTAPKVYKLSIALNAGVDSEKTSSANAAGFSLGYDSAVILPCKPDGSATGAPQDCLKEGTGVALYGAAGTAAAPTGTITAHAYGTAQGSLLAEFYYTFQPGKGSEDCYNGTFSLLSAYANFGAEAFVKNGPQDTSLALKELTYSDSDEQHMDRLSLSGKETVAVPPYFALNNSTPNRTPALLDIDIQAIDTTGKPTAIPNDVAWKLKEPATGVFVSGNSAGGALSVTGDAQAGSVVVVVSSGQFSAEHTVAITRTAPKPTLVELSCGSSDTISVASGKNDWRTYSATVHDQYGNPMERDITWSRTAPPSGVTSADGAVSVSSTASSGAFTLTAKSDLAKDSARITIKITDKEDPSGGGGTGGGGTGGGGGAPPPLPSETPVNVPAEPHGTKSIVTVKPTAASAGGGAYTATLTAEETTAILAAAAGTAKGAIVIAPTVGADATSVLLSLPQATMSALSTSAGKSLEMKSTVGTLALNAAALKTAVAAGGGDLTLSTTVSGSDKSILSVEIKVGNNTLQSLEKGVTLTAPMAETLQTPGAVAVLVAGDGSETVIRKSAVVDGSMIVPIDGSATVKLTQRGESFGDMAGHWAEKSAAFTSARNLFSGTGGDAFAPSMNMTRGMLVTVLNRLEDEPIAADAVDFPDVERGVWYENAVAWASERGIVQGANGSFSPENDISREQMATILYRYTEQQGMSVAGRSALTGFPDGDSTAAWSQDAMSWAVSAGLFTGKTGGVLDPTGTATRAEVAIILERFVTFAAQQR